MYSSDKNIRYNPPCFSRLKARFYAVNKLDDNPGFTFNNIDNDLRLSKLEKRFLFILVLVLKFKLQRYMKTIARCIFIFLRLNIYCIQNTSVKVTFC